MWLDWGAKAKQANFCEQGRRDVVARGPCGEPDRPWRGGFGPGTEVVEPDQAASGRNAAFMPALRQHPERGAVDLDASGSGRNFRQPESALRESLVVEHEVVSVPEEDLHPVASPSEKHEDVALIRVQVPRVSDKRYQPIVTLRSSAPCIRGGKRRRVRRRSGSPKSGL
jgi:hypothetical protein